MLVQRLPESCELRINAAVRLWDALTTGPNMPPAQARIPSCRRMQQQLRPKPLIYGLPWLEMVTVFPSNFVIWTVKGSL